MWINLNISFLFILVFYFIFLDIYKFLEHEHKSLFTDDTPLKEMDKDLIENKGKSL